MRRFIPGPLRWRPFTAVHALLAAVLTLSAVPSGAIVFWFDEREPFAEVSYELRRDLLGPVGGIFCTDGTIGTGFLVDVSSYLAEGESVHVVMSSAKVLYDQNTGFGRAICAFRSASAPDQLLTIGERLPGLPQVALMDPNDWVFAKVEDLPNLPAGLVLDFDAAASLAGQDDIDLWAVGYDREMRTVALTTDCEKTNTQLESSAPFEQGPQQLMMHNCDLFLDARGGPLAIQTPNGFRVVGIHVGDSQEETFERLQHIPFDPGRNFFNYGRRLDAAMENKLVAFLSRFAELSSPSEAIKAQRVLVRAVQANLIRLGYELGEADGLMGQRTSDAVKAFQTSLGINPTGNVSEELLLLLQAR